MTKEKGSNSSWSRFWNWLSKLLYDYRAWWFDGPSFILMYVFWAHFFSAGAHPVHLMFPKVYAIFLWIYIGTKHRVRKKGLGIQSRRGIIMVAAWIMELMVFFIYHSRYPGLYPDLPPYMVVTVIDVLLAFTGGVVLKKKFVQEFPNFGDLLESVDTQR